MRYMLWVVSLAGACSFTGRSPSGGAEERVDAPPRTPDASPDAAACPDGDSDGDTVCNGADVCPGHDDLADADADGVPDDCDDWPCGAKPSAPSIVVVVTTNNRRWTASNASVATARLAVAQRGAVIDYTFDYLMMINCFQQSPCRAQLEIGMTAPVDRVGCAVDRMVRDNQVENGTASGQLTAPATPGIYEVRLNGARMNSCGSSNLWYGGPPGPESTIAKLCVP